MADNLSKAAAQMGKRGGQKVLETFGRSYLSEIGKRGANSRWGNRKSKLQEDVVQVNEDKIVNVNPS